MKRIGQDRLRFARIRGRHLAAGLALVCLLAAGCEDFDPFGTGPAEPPQPAKPPSAEPAPPPAEPDKPRRPPPPHYPMGLGRRDLHDWVFSPDRTAMFPTNERNTVIRDFEAGRVLRLTAEGEACAWSPDGQWLLYWNRGWCVVNRNGKTNCRVTAFEGKPDTRPQWDGNLPIWHPDGPSLLVLDAKGRFRLVDVTGQRDRQIATTEQIPVRQRSSAPDFFVGPGGQWFFYVDRSRVGFLRSDGTEHRAGARALLSARPRNGRPAGRRCSSWPRRPTARAGWSGRRGGSTCPPVGSNPSAGPIRCAGRAAATPAPSRPAGSAWRTWPPTTTSPAWSSSTAGRGA